MRTHVRLSDTESSDIPPPAIPRVETPCATHQEAYRTTTREIPDSPSCHACVAIARLIFRASASLVTANSTGAFNCGSLHATAALPLMPDAGMHSPARCRAWPASFTCSVPGSRPVSNIDVHTKNLAALYNVSFLAPTMQLQLPAVAKTTYYTSSRLICAYSCLRNAKTE